MAQQFSNNARALLVAGISYSDTSLVIQSSKADLFPIANTGSASLPAATNWFKATLQNSAGDVEIVYVRTRTAGSGVFSNVIRGQEGTAALSFVAGTVVGLRVTAADLQSALGVAGQNNAFTGNNTFSGTNTFSGPITGAGIINLLYPVGSIYTNATNNTNPGTLFGVGTWVAFGAGRVPVGFDAANSLFNSAEETGGSYDATLVSHTHTASTGNQSADHSHTATTTISDPGHRHLTGVSAQAGINDGYGNAGVQGSYRIVNDTGYGGGRNSYTETVSTGISASTSIGGVSANHNHSVTVDTSGSSATNANIQPYITVYMWKRTA
jgi:hypothetical protein